MFQPLSTDQYPRVAPLYAGVDFHLAIEAVLAGAATGAVYVDDLSHPETAVVRTGHRLYLASSSTDLRFDDKLRHLFNETIFPQFKAEEKEVFLLHYYPDHWQAGLAETFHDLYPIDDRRLYFEFVAGRQSLRNDWRELLPPGFAVRPVDSRLLGEKGLQNMDWLVDEIHSEGPSVDEFLANRFGVCLVREDREIVGWCLSEYNLANRCEVGIATYEGYRRRGLATVLGSALIEQAFSHGVRRIGWHCWADNAGSVATAKKIGYVQGHEYPVIFAYFDPLVNLAVNGNIRFGRGEYRAAMEWFRRAAQAGGIPSWALFNAACASARIGDSEIAFAWLREALEKGSLDLERVLSSEHLQSLHEADEWRQFALLRPSKPSTTN